MELALLKQLPFFLSKISIISIISFYGVISNEKLKKISIYLFFHYCDRNRKHSISNTMLMAMTVVTSVYLIWHQNIYI